MVVTVTAVPPAGWFPAGTMMAPAWWCWCCVKKNLK